MITISHQNGMILIKDDHAKVIISNLKEFSEIIEKIKKTSIEIDDEIEYKSKVSMIDMLNSVRTEFLRYRELQCIKN